MARYALTIKQSARKELDALDDSTFDRIDRKLGALPENPRPSGCKKLHGYRDLWRIRVGDYRVIYRIDDTARVIDIVPIAHRRDVYES